MYGSTLLALVEGGWVGSNFKKNVTLLVLGGHSSVTYKWLAIIVAKLPTICTLELRVVHNQCNETKKKLQHITHTD